MPPLAYWGGCCLQVDTVLVYIIVNYAPSGALDCPLRARMEWAQSTITAGTDTLSA